MEGKVISAREKPHAMDRTRFLKLSGILGVGLATGIKKEGLTARLRLAPNRRKADEEFSSQQLFS